MTASLNSCSVKTLKVSKITYICKSISNSYSILVPFPIFRKNFMKNIKKLPTADALYLDEGVGNE
jgi:hypothetical protein